jgi:predicted nucleic acid-binding protein
MARSSLIAIIDTSFWFAICDSKDSYHRQAAAKNFEFEKYRILLPWPCLYELINTRFVKQQQAMMAFERLTKKPNLEFIDDSNYRYPAYEQTLQFALRDKRPISLVDTVIRLMLADVNIRVNCLVTFNPKDFADVCRKKNITIL